MRGEDPFQNESRDDPEYVVASSTDSSDDDMSATAMSVEELRQPHTTVDMYVNLTAQHIYY